MVVPGVVYLCIVNVQLYDIYVTTYMYAYEDELGANCERIMKLI